MKTKEIELLAVYEHQYYGETVETVGLATDEEMLEAMKQYYIEEPGFLRFEVYYHAEREPV